MAKQVQCKRCFHLNNDWCIPKMDSPDPDIVRDCQYYIAKTNGDRIRQMNNELLADIIDCPYGEDRKDCKMSNQFLFCVECKFDWLNKECE